MSSQNGSLKSITLQGDPDKGTIVLLHGYGADAEDLVPLSQIDPRFTWIFPQAPLEVSFAPGHIGRAWFEVDLELLFQATQSRRFHEIAKAFPPELAASRTIVDNFLSELPIPRSQIILGGFSQGAVLSIETALHSPHPIAGLLIFSGTLVHESMWRHLAPKQKGTPFFQSHGTQDPLLPLISAEELSKILIESGFKGQLHTFQGGHTIPQSILNKLALFLNSF